VKLGRSKAEALFFAIIIGYVCYAALFIYRTSFVVEDTRYYCLFDDAMVSMRYAENLASGQGLVWNPGGEKVEGFTNPLWVLGMAVFHLFPISSPKISLCVQICGALLLLINLFFVRRIARLLCPESTFVLLAAVLLTAFYLPLNNWGLQGMEVSLLALLLSMAVLATLRAAASGKTSSRPYLILGLATLVRLDAAVLYLALWAFLLYANPAARRVNWRWGLLILAGFLIGQILLRYEYYGELLPNTYALKMTGFPLLLRLTRGLSVTWTFIYRSGVVLFLLPFSLLWLRRSRWPLLLLWVFLAQLGYSIWVGGDAWETWGLTNRYVTAAMPLFFILLAASLDTLSSLTRRYWTEGRRWAGDVINVNLALILLLALIVFNLIYNPYPTLQEWLLLKPPLAVEKNREMVETARVLTKITAPEATIAVVWAGAIPYFSQRPAIDLLGKNDRTIARTKAHLPDSGSRYTAFYPGHMKWDYDYSIRQLQPDVIVQFYGLSRTQAEQYTFPEYRKIIIDNKSMHLRQNSPRILWARADNLGSWEEEH
jgi:arabinofuranosyltransferase